MAERYVFISKNSYPFYEKVYVTFDFFQGHALSQKRKCQIGLHQNFLAEYPDYKVLEISGASLYSLGRDLSAMNIKKHTSKGTTTVESAFQSSRIYVAESEVIGPFSELLFVDGKTSKKLVKEASKGLISKQYEFDGMIFFAPDFHISLFYDFLYINALLEEENKDVVRSLIDGGYNAFSDLATMSLNCQARSAAIFVGLYKAGKLAEVKNYESYLALFRTTKNGTATSSEAYESVQLLDAKGKEKALSPVVPLTFDRAKVELYYKEHCCCLTNKKDSDNYLDKVAVQG